MPVENAAPDATWSTNLTVFPGIWKTARPRSNSLQKSRSRLRRGTLPGDAVGDGEHLASYRLKVNLGRQQTG